MSGLNKAVGGLWASVTQATEGDSQATLGADCTDLQHFVTTLHDDAAASLRSKRTAVIHTESWPQMGLWRAPGYLTSHPGGVDSCADLL